ncbi:MAG: hypothetical protein N3D11_05615 [Candidatus Sumerlaeia bacterium]|nr:hypothetical protein [Candidatus Sumerlaeia bacterium]
MFARPYNVGKRLCLVGVFAALALTVAAGEPARIGTVKYLRDGKVDKIVFDYEGTLHYREYQFARAQYGYLLFEPAVLQESRTRLRPQGAAVLKSVEARPLADSERQQVRLLFELNNWVTPSIHDTGSRFEIRFTPGGELADLAQAGSSPQADSVPPATALTPVGETPKTGGFFARYLHFGGSDTAARAQPEAQAVAQPAQPAESAPTGVAQGGEGLPSTIAPIIPPPTADSVEPIRVAAAAAPPAGTPAPPAAPSPPPAAPVKSESPAPKFDIPKTSSKAYVPESTGEVGTGKITGSRGFEFVDLTEEQFQRKVTVTFKDADLQNAVRILARQAGINVVLDPAIVKARITVELNDVAIGPALAAILRANDLELVREAGAIYRVVESKKVRRQPTREEITVHVPLNWVSAVEVEKILTPIVEGRITADHLGNSVIVTDTPIKIEEIANVIQRMDRPEKQVMLEARLVEMNVNLSRALGISWDLAKADTNFEDDAFRQVLGTRPAVPRVYGYDPVSGSPLTFSPPGSPIIGTPPMATNPLSFDQRNIAGSVMGMDSVRVDQAINAVNGLKLALGTDVGNFQLSALIEAAENCNLAKVLAAPRVVTVNNRPAKINIIRQIPYSTTIIGAGGGQAITYSYEPVGITFDITPNITNNDYVRMNIKPTQKILIGWPNNDRTARPTIDERVSETNIIVKDEDTAVIAGLRQQEFSESGGGVPWLQQIPALGWLFKSRQYDTRKTDLMAFVTPHIIKETQMLTDHERQRYNEIDVQWDLPDYFFDDVKIDLSR